MVDLAVWVISAVAFLIVAALFIGSTYYLTILLFLCLPLAVAYLSDADSTGWIAAGIIEIIILFFIFLQKDTEENKPPAEEPYKVVSPPSFTEPKIIQAETPEKVEARQTIELREASKRFAPPAEISIEYQQISAIDNIEDIDDILPRLSPDEVDYLKLQGFYWQLVIDKFQVRSKYFRGEQVNISDERKESLLGVIEPLLSEAHDNLKMHSLYNENNYQQWFINKIDEVREEIK